MSSDVAAALYTTYAQHKTKKKTGRWVARSPTLILRQPYSLFLQSQTAPELVLCESLRGEEVERDGGRAGSENGLHHGHVEYHGFSGGRGRRKGHVLACSGRVDGERLVLK